MGRLGRLIGLRVWLALVLALVVAATAAAVATVFLGRFDAAFEDRAGQIAVGYAVEVAIRTSEAEDEPAVARAATAASDDVPLAVFLFDADGRPLTSNRSRSVRLELIPQHEEALAAALRGERFVLTAGDGSGTLVGLRVREGAASALVAYASHPELEEALGLARSKITEAALWGSVVGGLGGILVAALIARRLRRIAAGAAAIERGDFDRAVVARFPDEVGELASSIDRMRVNLRDTFAELASERDRLTRLLERLREGVVTIREGCIVDFANDAARELFGPDALRVGEPLPEPWPAVALRGLASGLFEEGAVVAHARAEIDADRTVVVAGIPAAGADTVVLVFQDVSEQERRERAEREFVSNAAHELRTPLQTILGAVEALKAGAKEKPEDLERFLAHIEREGLRLGRLTRTLLVLARAQTREEEVALAPVEIRPFLEEIAARMRPHDGVTVETACPPGLRALAEPSLLEHAVGNLAANAAQHTTNGRLTLSARRANGHVEIEVADTGPGIPAEVRERIFDRFFRAGPRDSEGFGLGLAIARESLRALGGDVVVDDNAEGGTRMLVRVRAADGGPA